MMTFIVEGMSCKHCVKKITDALMSMEGVKKVKADLKTKEVDVTIRGKVSRDEMKEVIEDLGYQVTIEEDCN